MSTETLKARLKQAATEGLVLGVKYAVTVAVLAGTFYFVFADYQRVRASAALGENAYRYLLAGVQNKRLPQDWGVGLLQPAGPLPVPAATPK